MTGDQVPMLAAACYAALLRALETAGRRKLGRRVHHLQQQVPKHLMYRMTGITSTDCDDLLEEAWKYLGTALQHCPDVDRVLTVVDGYARELLTTRATPSMAELARRLDAVVAADATR